MMWHLNWNLNDAKHFPTDVPWRNGEVIIALNADDLVRGIQQLLRFLAFVNTKYLPDDYECKGLTDELRLAPVERVVDLVCFFVYV